MFKHLYALYILFIIPNCYSHNNSKLIENIFETYNKDASPQFNNKPLNLSLGIALRAFKSIDQMEGTISTNVWLRYKWIDKRLSWNLYDYNYSFISLNTNPELDYSIWIPDIYLYNTAENPLSEIDYSRAIIKNDGEIIWSRPGIIMSTCSFDLTHFPYDRQNCYMKFGSWSYDGNQLDLFIYNNGFDISNYMKHEEWRLTNYYAEKNVQYYSCCPEPYPDIKFYYTITRRSGYYDLNIVLPTFATASLVLLTLLVPWSSGERISFAVTVMLSIIVFLLILSDNLPKSDQKPLLSRMIIGLTLFSLLGVFFTILISALSDYNEKFNKNEKTTTNKIIILIHNFFKSFKTCKKNKNQYIDNNHNDLNENNNEQNYNDNINDINNNDNNDNELNESNNEQNYNDNINDNINDNDNDNINTLSQNEIQDNFNNNSNKNLYRTHSYNESIRRRNNNYIINQSKNNNDNDLIKEECEKMINYFEHIYMLVFFFAFIIYCVVMFSIIPEYD